MTLRIKNLSKSYGEKHLFSDFSYDFPERGICIITGASGIGKTTLLRMITGLDTEYSGEIENGGIGKISYMFQEYRLFPTLSALKNVVAVTNETKEDESCARDLLTRLGFTSEDLGKKPHELSGGMKQRVAFARAVIKSAPILILDEPTKELDELSVNEMTKIIRSEGEKRLVLIVTHDDISKISENYTKITL